MAFVILWPLLGLTWGPPAASGGLDAPPWTTHPDDRPSARFDEAAVATCLEAARHALDTHAFRLEQMRFALSRPAGSEASCESPGLAPSTRAPSGLAPFDGHWHGRWSGRPVRHLWQRVRPDLQLVVFEHDGRFHRGVNLRAGGVLCGIVRAPDGTERLHEGRAYPATAHSPAYLKWMTPDRIYYERVACGARRTYTIAEYVVTRTGLRPGVRAAYREPDPVLAAPALGALR